MLKPFIKIEVIHKCAIETLSCRIGWLWGKINYQIPYMFPFKIKLQFYKNILNTHTLVGPLKLMNVLVNLIDKYFDNFIYF